MCAGSSWPDSPHRAEGTGLRATVNPAILRPSTFDDPAPMLPYARLRDALRPPAVWTRGDLTRGQV
jgi:hypothetical protein